MERLTDLKGRWVALLLSSLSLPALADTVNFSAIIGKDTDGCSVSVPENIFSFKPLRIRDLTGPVTAHEIKRLLVVLSCSDTTETIAPALSLTGNTPYSGIGDAVFVDGSMNGVGFMVRQGNRVTPTLENFYNTKDALKNNDTPLLLGSLDVNNGYYREEEFLIGLVGPFGDNITPGSFSTTLIINVVFQ